MRHRVNKVKLGREKDHLKSLLKNLATSLVLYEKIKTTKPKAKAVAPKVERLITLAKAADTGKKSQREVIRTMQKNLFDENATRKLLEELAKRYTDRSSGFTRIVNIGIRDGDAATMVQLELLP
ncbi:MAG: 50S ribosomal protein L17, large subunit ribosomal protein L17 [Candidatus Peregrinibacteria bacterium GW2011_GWE2_39_6]|nr:MAG: 50S ribosomal protein L17, large subunit ribosomal protein L17 [Candidatus Peregrinibacteria bacterium GW2011_GWF2_39_17]KKR26113.1 MAG: 50S ribosomal protein L17, large subunit ribosomal protein L17 [Candidatus Peregrinibacteria bacterium GW2011_GWE2_39_6]HCW32698.1 50S ribosomal protein L17 [Candidatus Peregrinibacteria bacterium]